MPTMITHAIVGASVTSLRPKSISPVKLIIFGAILAVLPDIDVLGFRNGIPYSSIYGHRGITHSFLFAAVISIIVALTFFPEAKRFSPTSWHVALLLFISAVSHGVLDAFTNAGLGIGFLIPFDETRYFAPWRPLTASPLSISRFLSGSGFPILLNEAKWVGIPLLASVIGIVLTRRFSSKADA